MLKKLISNSFLKNSIVLMGILFFGACDKNGGKLSQVNFDQKPMLQNWAQHIIVPAYAEFNSNLQQFSLLSDSLVNKPSNELLISLQKNFKQVYLSFQAVKCFEFGPASNISYKAMLNTYPCDTIKIVQNAQQANYNLSTAANADAIGLPAIDFLLFSCADELLNNAALRLYLQQCVNQVGNLTSQVVQEWNNGYSQQFTTAIGTDMGSSLGLVINALNKDYELIKNAKIGFPAGKKTLGQTFPNACEAVYADLSTELLAANITSIYNLYQGLHFNSTQRGPSLQDYLKETKISYYDEMLDQAIALQFEKAITAVQNIEQPLSKVISQQSSLIDEAYLEIQKNIVLLKTDLPSALGVLITYQDNDGD